MVEFEFEFEFCELSIVVTRVQTLNTLASNQSRRKHWTSKSASRDDGAVASHRRTLYGITLILCGRESQSVSRNRWMKMIQGTEKVSRAVGPAQYSWPPMNIISLHSLRIDRLHHGQRIFVAPSLSLSVHSLDRLRQFIAAILIAAVLYRF
jgi:hypothetical protein